jgi:hypothetical protein
MIGCIDASSTFSGAQTSTGEDDDDEEDDDDDDSSAAMVDVVTGCAAAIPEKTAIADVVVSHMWGGFLALTVISPSKS